MANNIALIGFMGCGKSTVGRLLATRLEREFIDTDAVIVRSAGRTIPEIFLEEGEAAFRDRESAALREAVETEGSVIATGGGAVLREENVRILRENALIVWLTARAEVIVRRTGHGVAARPVLAAWADDPLAHVLNLLGQRGPIYQRAAHRIVDTSDRTPAAIVNEIVRKLEKNQGTEKD
ncbi:MAG: shikimate kinase [Capsulimonadales bacterium]|nr:shikimate kinase [Capsulimonadales bacterium]